MYNKLHFYNTPLNIDITNHRQKEIAIIIIHGGIKMFLSFVSGFYLYGSLCSPCFLIGSYFDIKNSWLIIPVLLAVIGKHLTEEYYLYWIPSIYSGVSIAIAEINTLFFMPKSYYDYDMYMYLGIITIILWFVLGALYYYAVHKYEK